MILESFGRGDGNGVDALGGENSPMNGGSIPNDVDGVNSKAAVEDSNTNDEDEVSFVFPVCGSFVHCSSLNEKYSISNDVDGGNWNDVDDEEEISKLIHEAAIFSRKIFTKKKNFQK